MLNDWLEKKKRKLGKKQRATKEICFFNKLYCATL